MISTSSEAQGRYLEEFNDQLVANMTDQPLSSLSIPCYKNARSREACRRFSSSRRSS